METEDIPEQGEHLRMARRHTRHAGLIAETVYAAERAAAQARADASDDLSMGAGIKSAPDGFRLLGLTGGPWSGWRAACRHETSRLWLARSHDGILTSESSDPLAFSKAPTGCVILGYYEVKGAEGSMEWRPVRPLPQGTSA